MTPESTWNPKFRNLSYRLGTTTDSECDTEGIVHAIFEVCSPQNKWCVEVGAFDGYHGSNTYAFIQEGWSSLQIEGTDAVELLKKTYADSDVIVHYAMITPDYRGWDNELSQIFKKYAIPQNFDFLSLDIDGYDYEVWKSLQYSPNVIVIECNANEEDPEVIDYDPSYSVKDLAFEGFNPSRYGGATVGLLNKLAAFKGYELVCVDKHDAVYIKSEFAGGLRI